MPTICSYEFGRIVIDGVVYRMDVIIYHGGVLSPWWRKEGHRLCMDDLKEALKLAPKVIIIGTGYYGCMDVPKEVRKQLEELKIEVHVSDTRRACSIYNERKECQSVVAALHLTC
ncbi:MAG: Mth938-like domain-containing protein [Armatimonadota bacterium]|nr:Mth938-like domain-containing protein [Armatimonadota bacterium]MCX7778289.1 Mth938-like domain-containing protein [Armatimonadota bacterium]MDW8026323.1 Mth938-like domain-containing protein [Armatimonadota bacterium]